MLEATAHGRAPEAKYARQAVLRELEAAFPL
jgi:hypothetical protein